MATSISPLHSSLFSSPSKPKPFFKILAMAPKKKVNRYDDNWKKQWFGAGLFAEGSEDVNVDVVRKLEQRKVLSGVEKAGLLSKAESLGLTLSSIEKLGFFSKAEELGLLSLAETAADVSPSTLASLSLPLLVMAITAVGLFVGSIVLAGLQESD
ncbi:uncharacterized protein A4U43_C08F5460 [Asparagus officinalis]|uniref:uncharacterized protein LOC109820604 n=1 Tax=Asparagus officinalis TaxID=4686 RepID=UPI00098E0A2E|nr:uncharacterized protein LOC109820604 [Asparagus officinalis]XP_020242357.1 uncharacterized protein LOC109820604 [Asparagus officinalis]XP_020242359.1 uncharacterized protein LOC109820604 [Asparagus officinalis]XP_020242360.1 uncharacterized protein LOC109820604 [Asparagus officinalis]ONK59343.1 uncharacterized protein A4U43_C08F5460 [Asparagus officinalis]